MKKLIFIVIIVHFQFHIFAQNNFPPPTVIVGNTTYNIIRGVNYSTISNINNPYKNVINPLLDTNCVETNLNVTQIRNAVRAVYTNNPQKLIQLESGNNAQSFLNIGFFINPTTGQVLEVVFDLPNDTIITPEELSQMEINLKLLNFPQISSCYAMNWVSEWVVVDWKN